MQLKYAHFLADACNAAYYDYPLKSQKLNGLVNKLHVFERGTCRGFVGSNDTFIVVSFRGTDVRLNSPSQVIDSAKQWLRNLTICQREYEGGIRVHAGFDEDVCQIWNDVGNLILDHGGEFKPVLFTGHSAGAAIATLAAHQYKLAGLNVQSVYAFASPRVGNGIFAENYAVPLYRIENMDDLVPHVPLPPVAMEAADFVLELLSEIIMPIFPNLIPSLAGQYEYLHAGKLFFIDWDGDLCHSYTLSDFAQDFWACGEGKDMELPGTPIPKPLMDTARALRTYGAIIPEIAQGTFRFSRIIKWRSTSVVFRNSFLYQKKNGDL
ncbi:MAG: hypothetical protein R2911_21625 [Caldilineaceae bacterium]